MLVTSFPKEPAVVRAVWVKGLHKWVTLRAHMPLCVLQPGPDQQQMVYTLRHGLAKGWLSDSQLIFIGKWECLLAIFIAIN